METLKFIYYLENKIWIVWLEEYPDYHTQGESLEELKDNLKDLYEELSAGNIPYARKVGELIIG
jgi:predicted RNase H-like HicB family nuclease